MARLVVAADKEIKENTPADEAADTQKEHRQKSEAECESQGIDITGVEIVGVQIDAE